MHTHTYTATTLKTSRCILHIYSNTYTLTHTIFFYHMLQQPQPVLQSLKPKLFQNDYFHVNLEEDMWNIILIPVYTTRQPCYYMLL